MNKSQTISLIFFTLLLFGCEETEELPIERERLPPPPVLQIAEVQRKKTLTPEDADALIIAAIEAINKQDAEFFIPYFLERDQSKENVEAALKHYETYFQGNKISDFEYLNVEQLGKTGDAKPIQRFNYHIYTSSGISREVAVYQDNNIRINDPFLSYSFYANRLVERYISAIQRQDIKQLGQIFNIEEEVYSEAELKGVLARYKSSLSLDTLNYRLKGSNSEQQQFSYNLFTTDGDEHEIQVIYGDGMVNIKDEFLQGKN